ncbi:MarR family winged helix-turn-helix transcriptional regulator [Caproiciproducens sp.]
MDQAEKEKLIRAMHSLKRENAWGPPMEGVSRGEYFTLLTIRRLTQEAGESRPGAKATDLSRAAQMSRPAVSQMLNSLENKQLVERITAKSDRRVVYVKLSEKGAEQLEKTHRQFQHWFDRVMEELGPEDTAELTRLVNKLHGIMENFRADQGKGL